MMKKMSIAAAMASAMALSSAAYAGPNDMERCTVVDKDGHGLIKAHKSDCAGAGHSCAGQNKAGDANAWIIVPKGQCAKINAGDFSGVDESIKDKIKSAH